QAIRNLGGHDLSALSGAYRQIADDRPTVIFAYTIKGWRLPHEGHPQNHSNLLSSDEMRSLAADLGAVLDRPWEGFPAGSAEADLCARTAARLARPDARYSPIPPIPVDFGRVPGGSASTQQAL